MSEWQKDKLLELILGPTVAIVGATIALGADGLRWSVGLILFLAGLSVFVRSGLEWLGGEAQG